MSAPHRAATLADTRFGRFPYDPARLPFFYGWAVLGCGTIGVAMSAPGQTVGVSVFTDFLIDALHLSRSALSFAYLLGTVASALLLSRIGRLYDVYGGRWVAGVAAVAMALVLLGLSVSPAIVAGLSSLLPPGAAPAVAFVVIAFAFFLLRLSGQGTLTLASRNMVMEWFEQRRGLVNALLGVAVAFGFSSAPSLFEGLIQHGGWQWAWRVLAAAAAGFAVFALLTYRRRPEDHGLLPDGGASARTRRTHQETHAGRAFTLAEARRTYTFWVFALTATLGGLLVTALTFNVVSIFADAGMSRVRAVSVFLPVAFIAVSFEFGGSWLSDYVKLKYLAMLQLLGVMLVAVALATLRDGWPYVLLIVGLGMMQGMFSIVVGLAWPRFFGRAHLGQISGFAMAMIVTGTAVGPWLFSIARDLSGSYMPAAIGCGVLGLCLAVAAWRAERPA
ncbi:MFS transporter [Solimonas marina]|uniref:MFS transporter n=1 Tax=Solimonas marina TaxID=2714601 RepID=A0A969WDE3_9GAMM|nr:MFS transporter [Solimonas marina]NKF24494.1 MFS transporter [Solimonas marina]